MLNMYIVLTVVGFVLSVQRSNKNIIAVHVGDNDIFRENSLNSFFFYSTAR